MSWQDALILEKNEEVIHFWKGDYEVQIPAMFDGIPVTDKQKKEGILALTNRNLIFVEERGMFGKSYHTLMAVPLEDLRGISMGGVLSKYVSISDTHGEYIFHLSKPRVGNENELESFKRIIFDQVNTRKQELETEKKRERVRVLLDFSFLRSYMKKGGLVVQTIKCPNCGAPVKLPESGNQTECKHCGSTIYAQDIFEKVKALIG